MHREVEAVLQHVGRRTWDVVLIDLEGSWVRDGSKTWRRPRRSGSIRMHRSWEDPQDGTA